MSFFTRTLSRLRRSEGGFSLIETVVALGVLFVSLLVLARTAAVGFTDIAMSRQRQQANQLANQILEQVRGLTYARVGVGLETSDLSSDTSIVDCGAEGKYYLSCPSLDPDAEKIVHSDNPPDDVPLVPHRRTFGVSDGYTTTYTASVYVTEAKLVPSAGAFRVTAHVSWSPAQRSGLNNFVTTQSLLYTPEGTTDTTTGGGTAPFFYGTGSIGRAPVTMTPNPGVVGGTGLQGLPSWDSMTVNLYGLEASLQQQTLIRTESKVVLTGASKVVSGVETLAGGATAEAIADDDPATTPTTSSAPSSLMQETVTAEVSGGGQAIEVEAATGSLAPPCPTKSIVKMSGMESGNRILGTTHEFNTYQGGATIFDTAVARTGAYSLKLAPTTNTAAFAMSLPGGSGNDKYGVMHFAFRFASLPTADIVSLASFDQVSSTAEAGLFGYNASTNKFQVRFRNASNVLSTPVQASGTVTAGQWYTIDLRYDIGSGTHKLDWMIDGVAQTQATTSGSALLVLNSVSLGSRPNTSAFTANYDDFALSVTSGDYPIGDIRIGRLLPNSIPSWSFANGAITNNGGTAITTSSWNRLDEVPMTSSADYIEQVNTDTTGHVVVGFEDSAETCILGVRGIALLEKAASQAAHGRTEFFEGATPTLVRNGDHTVAGATGTVASQLAVTGGSWDTTELNGVTVKLGYSNDANPDLWWQSFQLQYAYLSAAAGGEGSAGTETGSTASTTAASAGTPCGTPTQVDGRACSYAREDYSTAGPPHLSLKAGTAGVDSAQARLYRFSPSTAPGSTSYVWGRRAAGGGGVGTVKETVVRYPGTHTFAPLPTFMGSGPAGWQGYWLKYDAGTSPSTVSAEAGIGAAAPSFTSAGTISYWNGTGYSSMAPPANGGDIPVIPVNFTSAGYRIEISGTLGTSQSFISQLPVGASGTADRFEARATLGSPVSGTFTYKVTYLASSEVVADFTISVDLGTLTATARYAP